ncbi:Uncharacterised protein [Bordetella pertussis]|nr:Uncharacterised protein [Bordetella pertussis]CFW54982.1 Uncharacterised protein [Bordetella pertussis]CPI64794.1 Uncharacterised protein [Bordetella pertussis]CPP21104.1 Uncharacterised protein [Bordetella pertussis]CPP73329.1 Uncharacterised protein [Bordetella pertussis]
MADRQQRGLGDAPQRQRERQPVRRLHDLGDEQQAGGHDQAEQDGGAQRAAVDQASAEPVAQYAGAAEGHHGPAHDLAVEAGQVLEHVGQVGVGGEHAGEDKQGQHHMAQQPGVAQDAQLGAQALVLAPRPRFGKVGQQQGLGPGHGGQHREGGAPAEGVGNQHADGNAQDGGGDDAEADDGYGAPGIGGADQLDGGGAGQRPEHGQRQGGHEAGERHDPDVGRDGGQGIGQAEQHQHPDEQALAFEIGQQGGQHRAGGGHREGEQRHQQAGLRHGDLQVARQGRQQADDQEFRGQNGKACRGQQNDGQQHRILRAPARRARWGERLDAPAAGRRRRRNVTLEECGDGIKTEISA